MAKYEITNENADFDLFKFINEDFLIEGISYIDNDNAQRSSTPIQPGTSSSMLDTVKQKNTSLMEYKMEEFDPKLVELEEVMSNSYDENSNLISATLSGIPLIELNMSENSIPKTEMMIIKAPENVDSSVLDNLPSLILKKSTIKAIDKASESVDGVIIPPLNLSEYAKPVRRVPLSVVQPVIQYTVEQTKDNKRASKSEKKIKKMRKRKQSFVFPREDGLMFFSDGESSPKHAYIL